MELTGSRQRSKQNVREGPHPFIYKDGKNDEDISEDGQQNEQHLK